MFVFATLIFESNVSLVAATTADLINLLRQNFFYTVEAVYYSRINVFYAFSEFLIIG